MAVTYPRRWYQDAMTVCGSCCSFGSFLKLCTPMQAAQDMTQIDETHEEVGPGRTRGPRNWT